MTLVPSVMEALVAWEPQAVGSGCIDIALLGFGVVKSLWVTRRAQVLKRVPEGALNGQFGQLKYIALCVCRYQDSLITTFMTVKSAEENSRCQTHPELPGQAWRAHPH